MKLFLRKLYFRTQSRGSYLQRGSTSVIVTSFAELSPPPSTESKSLESLLKMKAGCLGEGRAVASLLSMRRTADIVGLSITSSCTHRSPT
jgi:hypothetical protein